MQKAPFSPVNVQSTASCLNVLKPHMYEFPLSHFFLIGAFKPFKQASLQKLYTNLAASRVGDRYLVNACIISWRQLGLIKAHEEGRKAFTVLLRSKKPRGRQQSLASPHMTHLLT